ncbi:DUF6944 family repetitive protein [Niallia sp. MER TA 168]|uniref:DUF6944 family repetitive protein n=1 Tax=Niallia sp. MER TA 168 TaxID=2939568 RepID=UPI00203F818E|nr:hypothetical protein [Niallia sp. MER TA 168]MCM3362274.1 hypothetical protein [Niallia sp. MER TA 168]
MSGHFKEIFGSTINTIGTIQAAIGSTPSFHLSKETNYQLRLVGNVLQGTGSALSADGQGTISLEMLGDEIQAIGNSTVVTGLILYKLSKIPTEQKLIITGSWIQALGSFVGLTDEFFDHTADGRIENIIGGLLQGIGNSLQAVGGTEQLKGISSQQNLGTIGSWIQATGAVLSLIGQIKEEVEEVALNINE